ncbi:hypothetical protein SAMN04489716_1897 [Actinoplanes derwentensis]|uniref:Uncharacterized protein n=1 Tax=Actinoplanes derwentensis TaxID=113562 RepID=A0A1H1VVW6_9ACTN|nr:hypothetical protein SAMN04489716_1897 [Actinoplanes derwentensis]
MADGTGKANQRAESLRRMFPQRPPEPITPPLPVEEPKPEPRRRWPIAVAAVALLGVAGVAGALSLREPGEASLPPVQIGQGFPPVAPPSFDVTPPVPVASATPPSLSPAASAPDASGYAPQRATRPATVPGAGPITATKATVPDAGPITAYSACAVGKSVLFRATFADGFDYHHVFIDTDGDAATGYQITEVEGGFGADYLLENEFFYKSTGPGWDWREMDGESPLQVRSRDGYLWRLRADYGGVRAVFNGSDDADPEIFTAVTPVRSC